jgi:hypothetical protein
MQNQKLYIPKFPSGSVVKALETDNEFCKVYSFDKNRIEYVEVCLYEEMPEDMARCYDAADINYYKAN